MQVNFSRVVDYIPEFNDNKKLPETEQVKCKLKVLKLGHFLQLAETMGKLPQTSAGEIDLEAVQKKGIDDMKPLLLVAEDFFGQYVEIAGLLDGAGVPLKPVEVAGSPIFLALTAEIMGQLAAISMPTSIEVKN